MEFNYFRLKKKEEKRITKEDAESFLKILGVRIDDLELEGVGMRETHNDKIYRNIWFTDLGVAYLGENEVEITGNYFIQLKTSYKENGIWMPNKPRKVQINLRKRLG